MKKKNSLRLSKKGTLQIYLMTIIPFIFFVTFVIYPLIWVLRYAFYDYDGIRAEFIGLENFKYLMTDKIWWKAVYNTIYMTIGSLIVHPIALILAVLLNKKTAASSLCKTITYVPALISTAIVGVIFSIMLAPGNGIINEILKKFHLIDGSFYIMQSENMARWTVILIGIWQGIGVTMTVYLSGLQKISSDLYEAATIDGASRKKSFLYITIPQMRNIIKTQILLGIVAGMKMFDLVNVLTNGQPNHGTETMAKYIYNYFFEVDGYVAQQGYAAACSVVSSIIITAIMLIYFRASKNISED